MNNTNNKIILIGFMGAGKSSVLNPLAQKLALKSIEIDNIIKQSSGRKTTTEIFEKEGELKFRELEIEAARSLQKEDDCVIATGGGVIENKIILDYLRTKGVVVYLRTTFEEIERRIRLLGVSLGDRPLFKDGKKAEELYDLREPLYASYSDITINTDGKSIDQVVNEIQNELQLIH